MKKEKIAKLLLEMGYYLTFSTSKEYEYLEELEAKGIVKRIPNLEHHFGNLVNFKLSEDSKNQLVSPL